MIRWKKVLLWTLIVGSGGFTLYKIGSFVYMISIFDEFGSSSYKALAENYDLKTREVFELKTYIHSIVP